MTRRRRMLTVTLLCTLAALTAVSLVPRADAMVGDTALPECEAEGLPRILDLGLPQADGTDPQQLQQRIVLALSNVGRQAARCPQQPLQVNLAVGSHYQVLDWLGEGVVDAAVVPALSHYLLAADGVALRHLRLSGQGRDQLTPAWRQKLVSIDLENGDQASFRGSPEADLELFIASLWTPPPVARQGERRSGEAAATSDLCPRDGDRDDFPRLALPSHLSTTGFLDPVARAHAWVEGKLDREDEALRPDLRDCFWRAFFERTCFYFDAGGDVAGAGAAAPLCTVGGQGAAVHRIEIQVRRERADGGDGTAAAGGDGDRAEPRPPTRDRLLIREQAARDLFSAAALRDPDRFATYPDPAPAAVLPAWDDVADLFDSDGIPIPDPFRSLVQPDPYFGIRTFSFTVDETLGLLRLHQLTSRRTGLALVLPGGGVKSAYQSRLLDELYGRNHLRNYRVAQDGALPVEYVVGTSGGALLGFFVARQGEETSWNLSDILWKKRSEGGKLEPLTSADVFPATDLLRYVSVVTIFLIFCLVLAVVSLPHWGPLSPERAGKGEKEEKEEKEKELNEKELEETANGEEKGVKKVTRHPSFRPRLLLGLGAALFTAPLMVRWLSDLGTLEHTPEIEGLLFAVLVVLTMFADQGLVFDPDRKGDPAERRAVLSPALLTIFGGLMVAIPVLHRLTGDSPWAEWLTEPVSFRTAYTAFGASVLVVILASSREVTGRRRWISAAGWIGGALLASALAFALLLALPVRWLETADQWPVLLFALGAMIVLLGLWRLVHRLRGHRTWKRLASSQRFDALRGHQAPAWMPQVLGWGLKGVMLLAGSLVFLDLCRPTAESFSGAGLASAGDLLAENSKLLADAGVLTALLGLILLATAWILWLWERAPVYRFFEERRFVSGFLFLVGGMALAVCGLILLAGVLWDREYTLFELTASFWRGLVVGSFVLSIILVTWGIRAKRHQNWLSRQVRDALLYEAGRHPNGHVISRRFVRLALVAVGGLLWWNLVLAPGVYGNRVAQDYLAKAEQRFGGGLLDSSAAPGAATADSKPVRPFQSRLLAPANELAEKGTHFVLVVPESESCPSVRQPRGSGVTWHRFRALPSNGAAVPAGSGDCVDIHLTDEEKKGDLLSFVFASGSPFPVFPAHRVDMEPDVEGVQGKLLVDGGYSNNVPVEAAAMVEAAQMLIVHSSSPQECGEAGNWRWLLDATGPLIRNALHLPGFLFERSQQVDRRSRQGAFVASLAPVCRPDWPFLTEFSSHRVEYLLEAAEEDLDRRIGQVESWGPVRFQGGVQVVGEGGAAGGG